MEKKQNRRKIIIVSSIAAVILIAWFAFGSAKADTKESLSTRVQKGRFDITVVTTGEIKAKVQTDIEAPGQEMQQAGLWNGTKIQDLVAEGTMVKAGDFVASLDQSALMSRLQEVQVEYDKKTSEFKQARLDTAITLRDARDELLNLKSSMEEARLDLEQSAFEAPAIIRQKQLAMEKSERNFRQKTENYETKVEQSATKVAIINADLMKAQNSLNRVTGLMAKMVINAPKDGMVIYVKSWNGKKKGVGSMVNPWESAVATLPDLRDMQVVTYVNEVDIRKIKEGQAVTISLDAEPGKKLKGVVVQVANIGEQRPNQDSKVFEVVIDILTKDPTLRPSMTTSNTIFIESYNDVLSVPLEAVTTEKKNSYVWVKSGAGFTKQAVKIAAVNDYSALIFSGLSDAEDVLLNMPSDTIGEELQPAPGDKKPPTPFVDKKEREMLDKHIKENKPAPKSQSDEGGGSVITVED